MLSTRHCEVRLHLTHWRPGLHCYANESWQICFQYGTALQPEPTWFVSRCIILVKVGAHNSQGLPDLGCSLVHCMRRSRDGHNWRLNLHRCRSTGWSHPHTQRAPNPS